MIIFLFILTLFGGPAMAIEEPEFTVVSTNEAYEIRDYKAYILAEVTVEGELETATNDGFRLLAAYIFGKNRSRGSSLKEGGPSEKIAMTAPVVVGEASEPEKIAMTAPVNVIPAGTRTYRVQFTMPKSYQLETLPLPEDPRVILKPMSARRIAVRQYSGSWSPERYQEEKATLTQSILKAGLRPVGEAEFARYNSPFSLWFLRRNEVWIPIASGDSRDRKDP